MTIQPNADISDRDCEKCRKLIQQLPHTATLLECKRSFKSAHFLFFNTATHTNSACNFPPPPCNAFPDLADIQNLFYSHTSSHVTHISILRSPSTAKWSYVSSLWMFKSGMSPFCCPVFPLCSPPLSLSRDYGPGFQLSST